SPSTNAHRSHVALPCACVRPPRARRAGSGHELLAWHQRPVPRSPPFVRWRLASHANALVCVPAEILERPPANGKALGPAPQVGRKRGAAPAGVGAAPVAADGAWGGKRLRRCALCRLVGGLRVPG